MHETMRGCSFLQNPCRNTPWLNPFLTISSRECADKKHNAISQSAVSCAILQFFADLCKQKENGLVIKIYYPFGHNIYGGKTNETCVGPKMLSSYSRLKTSTNSKQFEQLGIFLVWRCGGFLSKKIFFLSTNFRSFFNCDQFCSAGANKKQLQKRI